uniref:transcription initiation factor TFIID subunit 4-like n=1 Tax=Nyctereutes procyonoides TaxID=34880 RepID=UPI002444BDEC|nr:transcription initiation factor TFIID subunit 4-like [Nyctereutes procyonoides]
MRSVCGEQGGPSVARWGAPLGEGTENRDLRRPGPRGLRAKPRKAPRSAALRGRFLPTRRRRRRCSRPGRPAGPRAGAGRAGRARGRRQPAEGAAPRLLPARTDRGLRAPGSGLRQRDRPGREARGRPRSASPCAEPLQRRQPHKTPQELEMQPCFIEDLLGAKHELSAPTASTSRFFLDTHCLGPGQGCGPGPGPGPGASGEQEPGCWRLAGWSQISSEPWRPCGKGGP